MNPGYIYLLSNPSLHTEAGDPIYKVGLTSNIEQRLKSLSCQTAIPKRFKLESYYAVKDMEAAEKLVHTILNAAGLHIGKEFFHGKGIPKILETLFIEPEIETQAEIVEAVPEKKTKFFSFSFVKCGISVGAKITYIKDSSIFCTVEGPKTVKFENKVYYLSGLTKEIETRRGTVNTSGAYQGCIYWQYKGKNLLEILQERL